MNTIDIIKTNIINMLEFRKETGELIQLNTRNLPQLKKSGCIGIGIGLETGSDWVRQNLLLKGKMNKFQDENSLLTQAWVMEPKKKVQDVLKELAINDLKIKEFSRIKIGE